MFEKRHICGVHIWGPGWPVTVRYLLSPSLSSLTVWLLPPASRLRLHCSLSPPGQQHLAPDSSLLLQHTSVSRRSLYHCPPCHLRERFNHLWPDPSFNDVRTLRGPPAPYKSLSSQLVFYPCYVCSNSDPAGRECAQWSRCVCATIPCSFPPYSISSESVTTFGFVYERMLGESEGGEPCARKSIWHRWDADTCCWTGESTLKIIRN